VFGVLDVRYINGIYKAVTGETWSNQDLLSHYEQAVDVLSVRHDEREKLLASLRFFLLGNRTRQTVPDWMALTDFSSRAQAFEAGVAVALDALVGQILNAVTSSGVVFDAVLTTTSSGNLMPGLSYRITTRLGNHVRSDSMLLDLGNVGCTGSVKALNLANQLDLSFKNILVVSVELPTTLINLMATDVDIWQGNCTFGDGAAALWISDDVAQGSTALALEQIRYIQKAQAGLGLIRWGYDDYYTFRLADEKTFNKDVRGLVADVLSGVNDEWLARPHWAIHPAGIALLMRLGRKLGLSQEAMKPSIVHYNQFSNMSSVSILHILSDLAVNAPFGAEINLLSMGAGFNVMYGYVRKER
jgi:alkylresorcinol/alkylpyrone synthase